MEIVAGQHQIGSFHLSLVASDDPDYFHTFLQHKIGELIFYVHLVDDERFFIFKHLLTFGRSINDIDVIEFNQHVRSVFHKIVQPIFVLHRQSISKVWETCIAISKKEKKARK